MAGMLHSHIEVIILVTSCPSCMTSCCRSKTFTLSPLPISLFKGQNVDIQKRLLLIYRICHLQNKQYYLFVCVKGVREGGGCLDRGCVFKNRLNWGYRFCLIKIIIVLQFLDFAKIQIHSFYLI